MRSVANGNCVIGKPAVIQLSGSQRELLLQAGFTDMSESSVSYSKLYICDHSRVVVTVRKRNRRNNSCISYVDRSGADQYGLLQHVVVVQDTPVALVVSLSSTAMKLCTDVITNADRHSHHCLLTSKVTTCH